jgi:hypothetical protein
MADEFKRTEVSRPGAPIREVRVEFPKHLKDAISESIDRGKRAGDDKNGEDLQVQLVEQVKVADRTPPQVDMSREVSRLEEGEALLQWPTNISPTSVQDLEDWLLLVLRKLKRQTSAKATDG